MINNRFNVVYHLLCVGVGYLVETSFGELNKNFKRKKWEF
jgi:hypothetical protein